MNQFTNKIWLSGTTRFTLATGGIVILLFAAYLSPAWMSFIALCYMTGLIYVLDRLTALAAPDFPEQEFPAGSRLMVGLGLVHFPLLFIGAYVISNAPLIKALPLFFALALFLGQVSNSNAHELIHCAQRWKHRLGVAVFSSLFFGHHASAHPLVHHVYVATPEDPNSARKGDGFYRFARRAWRGSFRAGLQAERRRNNLRKTYGLYGAIAGLTLLTAFALGGGACVFMIFILGLYAQAQLLLSDYVQHYGLQRKKLSNGRYEPVGPHHSWNAPQGFSSALMINAPRHSDHHSHPTRTYPNLILDQKNMPILPNSLPVMATIALIPRLWKRIMDPAVDSWVAQDLTVSGDQPTLIPPTKTQAS